MVDSFATNPVQISKRPPGWQIMPIGSLCERVTSGATPLRTREDYFAGGTIPWFKTQELNDGWLEDSLEHITELALRETSVKMFPPNTVLIAMYGDGKTITSTGILRKPATTNQACCAMITDSSRCDFRYLFYALQFHRGDFIQLATGGAQRNLSVGLISEFEIRVPPLSEQHAIASVLGALDDMIHVNQQMNVTLEAIVCAIFSETFASSVARSANVDVIPFGSLVLISREAVDPGDLPSEVFQHYSIPAFDEKRLPVKETGEQIKSHKFVVYPDSVLLSKLNPRIPRVWLPAVDSNAKSICSTEFLVLRPKEPFPREFIYGLCRSKSFQEAFSGMVTGTSGSHQRVKADYLEKLPIVRPSIEALERFKEHVNTLHRRSAHNLQENVTLATLRDTLLQKLISGELRLRNIDSTAEGI
jgi:type I restriction enzyme S subunit